MPPTNRGPKTARELFGGEGEMYLNQKATATCPNCGQEPKEHRTKTPSGREFVVFIPANHACPGGK